ncbi:hypothetical protein CDL15_Pgr012946 [Punica granatum]|uniref:Uncharacterized protein n=1 Tax=Punica granatum TaxID=22663 RepID=A0A218XE37_PUNGR|nr:hypothetical protein CDL15_Pgr012946 [Punica granatum]
MDFLETNPWQFVQEPVYGSDLVRIYSKIAFSFSLISAVISFRFRPLCRQNPMAIIESFLPKTCFIWTIFKRPIFRVPSPGKKEHELAIFLFH